MPYTHTKLSDAATLLAAWLTDSGNVRFLVDECELCIKESLRTFSLLTGIHESESDPVTIAASTAFIDLPTEFAEFCGYTLLDQDLVGMIQYHMLEPKSVSAWTGSERFTLDDITQALQRTRDRLLLETGCRLTRSQPPASPAVLGPDTPSYDLDQSIIDVERVAWRTLDGKLSRLWPESAFSIRASNPGLAAPSTPLAYQLIKRAPMTLEFSPPPSNDGTLDLLTVNTGADLDPTTGVLLGVPDDLTPAVKWGAMADLLSKDGPARDYARALFCERRYRVLVAAALTYRSVSDAFVNGRPAQIDVIDALDMARPNWQSRTGSTICVAMAGMNLLALEQPPKSAISLQLTIRRNAPIPATSDDYLQIGREYLETILGYALHLAMFKIGGQELAATTHLAESFFLAAAEYNSALNDSSAFEEAAYGTNQKRDKQKDRGIRRVTGATVSEA